MSYRINRVVTKTGDQGTTGLSDGSRVSKHDLRIEAIGTIDELNSHWGLLLAQPDLSSDFKTLLAPIHHRLFDLGGELSIPGASLVTAEAIALLDDWIHEHNARLPKLTEFVIPGGSVLVAQCHVTRTVCRRAERAVVALHSQTPVNPNSLVFLNRLSDWLFVLARVLTHEARVTEHLWRR